mmetsp:Transcript_28899/g.85404  ORF Transcript_28899/g.85404 Transcript_28899/m.85404 type:complete len:203 (-) Transcript_28899:1243-1851(-)
MVPISHDAEFGIGDRQYVGGRTQGELGGEIPLGIGIVHRDAQRQTPPFPSGRIGIVPKDADGVGRCRGGEGQYRQRIPLVAQVQRVSDSGGAGQIRHATSQHGPAVSILVEGVHRHEAVPLGVILLGGADRQGPPVRAGTEAIPELFVLIGPPQILTQLEILLVVAAVRERPYHSHVPRIAVGAVIGQPDRDDGGVVRNVHG